jgi:GNAT superfamily N-acetyltransferase
MNLRRYKLLCDFEKVSQFLINNYLDYSKSGNMQQPWWEYGHTHPSFNYRLAHRFGIWEENDEIIAVACFENDLGDAFFNVKLGYEKMKPEMLAYAEQELCEIKDGKHSLCVSVYDHETEFREVLEKQGYKKVYEEPVTVYRYEKGFKDIKLPEGFSLISLEEETNFRKINDVLWKGFDHGDEPDDDLDCRMQMQSGPHFKKDLTLVIKAPNGEYACFCGMWVDEVNHYAFLEPLATDPKYRRLGLATYALMESMKRTMKYGATYCYGGQREFYFYIGFEKVCMREIWKKVW